MTADRTYRKALPHHTAREELRANAGTQFDPAVVDAFLTAIEPGQEQPPDYATHTAIHHDGAHIRTLLLTTPRLAAGLTTD